MTAKSGTPKNIPNIPNNAPITSMAIIIHTPPMPTLSPSMFGAIIFPSICCTTSIITAKTIAFLSPPSGTTSTIMALGIAPRKGPKTGIRSVTPMISEIIG